MCAAQRSREGNALRRARMRAGDDHEPANIRGLAALHDLLLPPEAPEVEHGAIAP